MSLFAATSRVGILAFVATLTAAVFTVAPQLGDAAMVGARGGGAMRTGPAASGSVRRSHAGSIRDSRRDFGTHRRDTRREVGDNRREVRRDVRKERHEFREDAVRRHRGRHLTYAAFRSLSCRSTVVIVNGIRYYSCGGTYYERVYQGGTVVYVVVAPPPGY